MIRSVRPDFSLLLVVSLLWTPAHPLFEPEDLLNARIAEATPQARELGVEPGMTGREAVERFLAKSS